MSFQVKQHLQGSDIKRVIHIGADRGGELPLYHAMGVEEIVWVEANPDVYGELLINLERMNFPVKSKTYNQLISDTDDVDTEFNIIYGHDAGPMVGNKGMSSILKPRHSWWGSECLRGTIKLKSLTVDTFLERNDLGYEFDLLNMDTQGAELMISRGATKLLEHVKFINSEVTFKNPQYQNNPLFDELYSYFKEYGFVHVDTELSGEGTWGDALFVKE